MGLHTHGMVGFHAERISEAFQMPEDFEAVACWALGRFGNPADLVEILQSKEVAPRARKIASQVVFGNIWDQLAI